MTVSCSKALAPHLVHFKLLANKKQIGLKDIETKDRSMCYG